MFRMMEARTAAGVARSPHATMTGTETGEALNIMGVTIVTATATTRATGTTATRTGTTMGIGQRPSITGTMTTGAAAHGATLLGMRMVVRMRGRRGHFRLTIGVMIGLRRCVFLTHV